MFVDYIIYLNLYLMWTLGHQKCVLFRKVHFDSGVKKSVGACSCALVNKVLLNLRWGGGIHSFIFNKIALSATLQVSI